MQPSLAFIILTWNSERYISNCLNSINHLEQLDTSIYIVDNGSSDRTLEIIKKDFPNVHLITLSENIGTTKSRNIALRLVPSTIDYVCILDSDTVINQNAVTKLIDCLLKDERNGIAIPSMVNAVGERQISCKHFPNIPIKLLKPMPIAKLEHLGRRLENYDFSENHAFYPVDYGISACWMIKRNCLDDIGLLDEHIFYAPEDVDYCLRAWQTGFKVIYVPEALIIHDTQRISRKKYISKVNYEHIKGLLYFFHKHGYWFRRPRFE